MFKFSVNFPVHTYIFPAQSTVCGKDERAVSRECRLVSDVAYSS